MYLFMVNKNYNMDLRYRIGITGTNMCLACCYVTNPDCIDRQKIIGNLYESSDAIYGCRYWRLDG